jgi:hypothetical protein
MNRLKPDLMSLNILIAVQSARPDSVFIRPVIPIRGEGRLSEAIQGLHDKAKNTNDPGE